MKKVNFLIAVSAICIMALNSCKSDVQKAAENYFALEQLPKYQVAAKLTDAEVTGEIKVLEGMKEVVYKYQNYEYFVEMEKETVEFRKKHIADLQESIDFSISLGIEPDSFMLEQMADAKSKYLEDSLTLVETIADYDSLKATKAIYAYVYPCIETINIKLNGAEKEVSDTIYMYIDEENKVLKMTDEK